MRLFGVAAGATAVAAGLALHATGAHAERQRQQRLDHNEDLPATKWQRQGTGPLDNIDGLSRIALLSAATLATVVGVVQLRSSPRQAALLGGIALGATGAALLAGPGPLGSRIQSNGRSVASALGSHVRERLQPERPDVAAAAREVATTDAPPARRPTARAIRDAKLPLPGTPDEQLAQRNAEQALAQIDWSKPDIVLWLPGTSEHVQTGQWVSDVEGSMQRPASAVLVDHPAALDFDSSVATGMRSLQLVLAGIAEHGGADRRVFAAGYSQGGWIVGDAMAVPAIRDSIDRAVFFGHPGLAVQDYADGHDPKVLEVNDGNDPITWDVPDRRVLIDAMRVFEQGAALQHPVTTIASAVQNPVLTEYWTARMVDPERWPGNDPHEYYGSYAAGLDWLDQAPLPRPAATDADRR